MQESCIVATTIWLNDNKHTRNQIIPARSKVARWETRDDRFYFRRVAEITTDVLEARARTRLVLVSQQELCGVRVAFSPCLVVSPTTAASGEFGKRKVDVDCRRLQPACLIDIYLPSHEVCAQYIHHKFLVTHRHMTNTISISKSKSSAMTWLIVRQTNSVIIETLPLKLKSS